LEQEQLAKALFLGAVPSSHNQVLKVASSVKMAVGHYSVLRHLFSVAKMLFNPGLKKPKVMKTKMMVRATMSLNRLMTSLLLLPGTTRLRH